MTNNQWDYKKETFYNFIRLIGMALQNGGKKDVKMDSSKFIDSSPFNGLCWNR